MNTANKNTLIVGFGVSGLATARHLLKTGVSFDIADQNVARVESWITGIKQDQTASANAISAIADDWTEDLFLRYQCLVVSPGVATRTKAFQAARAAGVEVIGDVELFARAVRKPVIAVTGSNGKSTVVSMTGELLKAAGLNVVVAGNVGLACLDGLNDDAVDVYVLELSSFQLETTHSLQSLVATVLNVSEDHMDRYESLEDYAMVKRSVYRNARVAVVNADDHRSRSTGEHDRVAEFSVLEADTEWFLQCDKDTMNLCGPDKISIDASVLRVDGGHNRSNALASMALVSTALSAMGSTPNSACREIDLNKVFASGLSNFSGLPHRTQLVRRSNGVNWFNDSKGTNVGACVSAIEGMAGPVVLIAGGRGKDANFSPLSQAVEQKCRAVVLIGEDAEKINQAIGDRVPVYIETTLTDAVNRASRIALAGDSVLLSPACASFDMFANFEARGDAFAKEVNRLCA